MIQTFLLRKRNYLSVEIVTLRKEIISIKHENGLVNTHIFIDYYSSYVRGQEENLITVLINQLADAEMTSLVVLLPIQMCGEGEKIVNFPFPNLLKKIGRFVLPFFICLPYMGHGGR